MRRGIERSALASMRPMKSGELIDRGLRIYQRNGILLLRQTSLAALLCVSALAVLDNFVLPLAFTSAPGARPASELASAAIAGAIAVLLGGPLFVIGLTWIAGFSSKVALETLSGREIDEDECLEFTRNKLGTLGRALGRTMAKSSALGLVCAGVMLLGGVLTQVLGSEDVLPGLLVGSGIVGLLPAVIVWIYVRIQEALIAPVVMFEPVQSSKSAARRSRTLLKSNRYHASGTDSIGNASGLMIILFILFFGSISAAQGLLGLDGIVESLFDAGPVRTVVKTIIDVLPVYFMIWTILPAWSVVASSVYFDRCIRIEGLDIETLASFIEPRESRTLA